MALVVCKACKKAFISGLQEKEVCSDCFIRLREIYPSVRGFIRDHDGREYTAQDVSKIMDIALEDVIGLVSMGLLEFKINPQSGELQSIRNALATPSQKTKALGGGT